MRKHFLPRAFVMAALCAAQDPFPTAGAETSTVSVADNVFIPNTTTINVNDSVRWVWTGVNPHTTTSTGGLWNSGIHGNGFAFTNTFMSAGSYPYRCTVHALQTGSVTVRAANAPPLVAIQAPASGAVFAAPWQGIIRATASDSDGSVLKVDFHAGTNLLGTVSNPPPTVDFVVAGLAAGGYALRAVALDNQGTTTSSAEVPISVVTPAPISLSAPFKPTATSFQFAYAATPGLRYLVQRSDTLAGWTPLRTNTATSTSETFVDQAATLPFGFYSVTLAPNP